jgi:hypothetical protein
MNGTNRIVNKFLKPTGTSYSIVLLENSPAQGEAFFSNASWGSLNIIGKYVFNINQDSVLMSNIKQSFCATTGNPSDCQTKVNILAPPIDPIMFEIDNFKAYGIKNDVNGLENQFQPTPTRTLVAMCNALGEKLALDQTHEGLVVKMYSDGTREKVMIK